MADTDTEKSLPEDCIEAWFRAVDQFRAGGQPADIVETLLPVSDRSSGEAVFIRVRSMLTLGAVLGGSVLRREVGCEVTSERGFGFELYDDPACTGGPARVVRPEDSGSAGLAAQLLIAGANSVDGRDDDVHALINARVPYECDEAQQKMAVEAVLDLLQIFSSLAADDTAADGAGQAPAGAMTGAAVVPRDGRMHEVQPDARDSGPDRDTRTTLGRHGSVVGALTLHVVGVTERDTINAQLQAMIGQMPRPAGDRPLCGVLHVADVGIWETPHTGRDVLRREVVRLRQQYRREVVIVHGFQHIGPCPNEGADRG